MRDIAVGIWQKIAGEDLHGGEEYEKHRRASKRLGPKAHLPLSCHIPPQRADARNEASPVPFLSLCTNQQVRDIGPEAICMGDIQNISEESWILRLKHFMVGDVHKLIAFIDQFPKMPAQDRYILSSELGDGRVLSAAPRLTKEPDGYMLVCPVEHGCPRIDVQKLGSTSALHPKT